MLFHGQHASPELIVRVLACRAAGLGIRGPARGVELEPHTVRSWGVEAAEQLQALSADFLHEVLIKQVQRDALSAGRSAVRDGTMSEAEAIERLARAPHWVWTAIAPEPKGPLSVQSGERTLAMAQAMLHHLAQLLAPGGVPLVLSDRYPYYLPAIVTPCGPWVQPPRRPAQGPTPQPRWMPLAALLYAPVVQTLRRRRLVEVKHHVVCGTQAAGDQVLAACGWQINTALGERLNLSRRPRVAAMRRRSALSCKGADGLGPPLALFQVDHNCGLPHARVCQALAEPIAPPGTGAAKVGRPCTPARAADWTDRVWSLKEVLRYRVPPWPQPQTV